jgi:polyketide cyclase/dehydrase/lipid transport protein
MISGQLTTVVDARVGVVFDFLSDLRNADEWLHGVTNMKLIGDREGGLGSRYLGTLKVGPKQFHSVIEVIGWEPNRLFATTTRSGFVSTSMWHTRALTSGRTEVSVDVVWHLPGGIAGRALAKLIEPIAKVAMAKSTEDLKRCVEQMAVVRTLLTAESAPGGVRCAESTLNFGLTPAATRYHAAQGFESP